MTEPVRKPAQPLRSTKGVTDISNKHEDVVEWDGKKSVRTFHIFINETAQPVELYWFYDKKEEHRGTIEPGSNVYIGTYTFNQWKVKSTAGHLLGLHAGQSATVTIKPSGCVIAFNSATADADDRDQRSMDTPNGRYAIRASAMGMPVWAFDCVPDKAVQRAVHVAMCMLEGCPVSILQHMMGHRPSMAVFGRNHVVSDVPSHSFMRFNVDRNLNATSRGLGGTPTVPVTSCAEENLTMEDDKLYPCQSILVHELGHAVQNLGMDTDTKERVQAAYTAALSEGLYPEGCYMMANDHEYWATGTEAWFESTIRVDVNGGVNTRDKARTHDPRLAAVLAEVYGDGQWRYHHDCPHPLSFYHRPAANTTTTTATTTATTANTSAANRNDSTNSTSTALDNTTLSSTARPITISTTNTTPPHSSEPQPAPAQASTKPTVTTSSNTANTSGGGTGGTNGMPSGGGGGPTRRLPGRSSAGTAGTSGGGAWAADEQVFPRTDGAGPNAVVLDAPATVVGLSHSPTSSQGEEGDVGKWPGGNDGSEPAGMWGGFMHWANPLTYMCPGARMCLSDSKEEDEDDQGGGEAGSQGDGDRGAGGLSQHSPEVIAILSGGALTGGVEELAAASAANEQGATQDDLQDSAAFYLLPFANCLQGREKKFKHSAKNM